MPFCFECGAKVAPDDPFCGNCGSAQKSPAVRPDQSDLLEQTSAPPAEPVRTGMETPGGDRQPASPDSVETVISSIKALLPDESEAIEPDARPAPDSPAADMEDTIVGFYRPANQTPVAAEGATPADSSEKESDAIIRDLNLESEQWSLEETVQRAAPAPVESADSDSPVVEKSEELPAALETDSTDVQAAPDTTSDSAGQPDLHDTAQPEDQAAAMGEDELSSQEVALPPQADRRHQQTLPSGSTGGRKQSNKQLESGTVLNVRYEIVRRIGGGGMGAVYLAKDRHLGDAPRAVKEMIESHLDDSQHEKAIGDFKRESLLLTSLEHSSIPTIYDYFYDEQAGRFYLVMKYISGGDFASRLRNAPGGRIDEKTVTLWGMEVADVLDYLHNRRPQIIYRDLKPANLMIDGNSGRVMLIDFGIARWVKKEEKGVTAVGTMGYAPPELFSGKVEPRSDIYSLGATMFHLLTGADPQDNPLLIFDFTKNPRPRQINPAISVEMERILMRAVEYKPEGRFRSAAEMREALAAHHERLRVGDVSYGIVSAQDGVGETLQIEMVFCGFCGGRIAGDDLYCAHCGAKQPLAAVGASAALQAGRGTAKLIVAGTTELDASFLLNKDSNLVGRSDPHSNIFPEVDLSKFDPETKVSRRHARIWRKGETFLVEDLGSVNGTVVHGRDNDTVRLAPHQPRVLENGDKLRLGETMLHFLVG